MNTPREMRALTDATVGIRMAEDHIRRLERRRRDLELSLPRLRAARDKAARKYLREHPEMPVPLAAIMWDLEESEIQGLRESP